MESAYDNTQAQLDYYFQVLTDYAIQFGFRVVAAIIILIVGFRVIKITVRSVEKGLNKDHIDSSLASFLRSLTSITLKALLIIIAASIIGIQTASLVVIIGAAALAIGIALQGSLSNFAGGFILLFLKPFKVGDQITGDGYFGTVTDIQLFYTILTTPDNKRIVIPNGRLSNNSITNFSFYGNRRIDFSFSLPYSENLDKIRQSFAALFEKDDRILKDPAPMVAIEELDEKTVRITVRIWVKTDDYWNVNFDTLEKAKLLLGK